MLNLNISKITTDQKVIHYLVKGVANVSQDCARISNEEVLKGKGKHKISGR